MLQCHWLSVVREKSKQQNKINVKWYYLTHAVYLMTHLHGFLHHWTNCSSLSWYAGGNPGSLRQLVSQGDPGNILRKSYILNNTSTSSYTWIQFYSGVFKSLSKWVVTFLLSIGHWCIRQSIFSIFRPSIVEDGLRSRQKWVQFLLLTYFCLRKDDTCFGWSTSILVDSEKSQRPKFSTQGGGCDAVVNTKLW